MTGKYIREKYSSSCPWKHGHPSKQCGNGKSRKIPIRKTESLATNLSIWIPEMPGCTSDNCTLFSKASAGDALADAPPNAPVVELADTQSWGGCAISVWVRFPPGAPNAPLAQLVEQRTENPCVSGSIPLGSTNTPTVRQWRKPLRETHIPGSFFPNLLESNNEDVPCTVGNGTTWKRGRVWFKAAVLKTAEEQSSVGSNPTVSATFRHSSAGRAADC